jgi:HNH endonuclease
MSRSRHMVAWRPSRRRCRQCKHATHRLGWKLLRGPIPEGKELHHRCGVYACWNPGHLELVTHAENQFRLRKTHCGTATRCAVTNLRIGPNGARTCRACNAANQRAFRERHARRSR